MPKLLVPTPPPDPVAEEAERALFLATVAALADETGQALNDLRVVLQRLPTLPEPQTRIWVAAAIAEHALAAFAYWYERSVAANDTD